MCVEVICRQLDDAIRGERVHIAGALHSLKDVIQDMIQVDRLCAHGKLIRKELTRESPCYTLLNMMSKESREMSL